MGAGDNLEKGNKSETQGGKSNLSTSVQRGLGSTAIKAANR